MTMLVWYCRRCHGACKVQPADAMHIVCTCKTPVPGLRPAEVTVAPQPTQRRLHALSDEEARIRALARKGTRVRITFEATVTNATQWTAGDRRGLEFDLRTSGGRRYSIDPQLPGLHIEAAPADEESAS
ncbi:hypothetical protein ACIPJG_33585 [Streptomyces halstedii]|uniref:hypothetical protein n=1 Tax=Streptomyces halstedii TaxID=1944 RepID=UPI00382595D3